MEKILTLLVGLLIALGGWSLSRTFELSTNQAVLENKVDHLEMSLQLIDQKMDEMFDMDEEIMKQHEELFKKLQNSNTGYSYNQEKILIETVFALLLIIDNEIKEHRIQDSLSKCLKAKRYAMRDKGSEDRVTYQCIKSKANIEIYMGEKKITSLILK